MSDMSCDQSVATAWTMSPIPSGTLAEGIVGDMSVDEAPKMAMAMPKRRSSSPNPAASGAKGASAPVPRGWSVRAQAQGHIIGGTSGSTLGATPVSNPARPVTAQEGLAHAQRTFNMLNHGQAAALTNAYAKCVKYVSNCPPNGYLGKKTFRNDSRTCNRFDMDSFGPSNNFIK